MSYGTDLIQALHHAGLFIGQSFQYQTDRFSVIRHGSYGLFLLAAIGGIGDPASFDTDSLTETLCDAFLGLGIDELELQRRASAVNN